MEATSKEMNKEQSKQTCTTLLEHLPNELFVKIFSYTDGVDTIVAFSQLNNRFQHLLLEYGQSFYFKSVRKTKFDLVLQQQHPILACKSLQLSNDDHTPAQIQYFCECYSLVDLCPHLQFLSGLKMEAIYGYTFLLEQLELLSNLTSLTIESECGETMPKFHLLNLKRLVLKSCTNTRSIKVSLPEIRINNLCFHIAGFFST